MSSISRLPVALAMAASLVLVATGCSSVTKVDSDAGSATVPEGGTLVVDFGEINQSVGDDWVIIVEPDPAVLGDGVPEYLGEDGAPPGGSSRLTYSFPAVGKGTSQLWARAQRRSSSSIDSAERPLTTRRIRRPSR